MGRYDILGADEVRNLLGAWQSIVGANPWFGSMGGFGGMSGAVPALAHGPYGGQGATDHRGNPGGWVAAPSYAPPVQYGPPPRNALVDRPPPGRADRILLPMTSSGNITSTGTVTARPQNVAYRPERIIIGGTPANWLLNDIKVGNRSQLSQAGELPGEAFANTAIDTFVSFETVQTAMDFVIQVTFIGTNSAGEQFKAAVFGTAAISG